MRAGEVSESRFWTVLFGLRRHVKLVQLTVCGCTVKNYCLHWCNSSGEELRTAVHTSCDRFKSFHASLFEYSSLIGT